MPTPNPWGEGRRANLLHLALHNTEPLNQCQRLQGSLITGPLDAQLRNQVHQALKLPADPSSSRPGYWSSAFTVCWGILSLPPKNYFIKSCKSENICLFPGPGWPEWPSFLLPDPFLSWALCCSTIVSCLSKELPSLERQRPQ